MNCLNESTLQKYLDGELADTALMEVETHLKLCPVCLDNYTLAKNAKQQVFNFIEELSSLEPEIEIPVFQYPSKTSRFKKLVYIGISIAASILIFIGIGIQFNNHKAKQKQLENITKATYELTRNTDMNKVIHNKQIMVVVTNASGEVIETSFE